MSEKKAEKKITFENGITFDPKIHDPRAKNMKYLKPIKKGEVRNPTGKTGINQATEFAKLFKEAMTAEGEDAAKILREMMKTGALKAKAGDPRFWDSFMDRIVGKPVQTIHQKTKVEHTVTGNYEDAIDVMIDDE